MNYGKLTAGTTKTAIDTAKPSEKGEIITYLSRMGDALHGEKERGHDVLPLSVKVVRDGNIVNAVLGEELLSVVAGFPHIAAQTGQVFGNDGVGLALLELLHHFLKGRAVKVAAGVAIIRKLPHQSDTVLLAVVLYDHALVRNTGRFPALRFLVGEP